MLETHKKLLSLHAKLATLSASTANLEKLLQKILESILKLVSADSGSIMVYSPQENRLRLFRSVQHPGSPRRLTFRINEGVAGQVFQEGKTIRVEDVKKSPQGLSLQRKDGGGSFMSLPLKISRRIIGVLNLNRFPGQPGFAQQDEDILSTLMSPIAGIVEKGRLLDEVDRRSREMESLYSLSQILFSGKLFPETLHEFLEKLADHLDLQRSAVLKFRQKPDSQEEEFLILASVRLADHDLKRITKAVFDRTQEHMGQPTPDPAEEDQDTPMTLSYYETGQSMDLFCLPIPNPGPTKYFLIVSRRQNLIDPDAIQEHHRFLAHVAKQLAIALDRQDMIDRLEKDQQILMENAYQNNVYLNISKELATTLDPHLVLRKAFDQFGALIPFSSITILLFDDLENTYQMIVQPYGPLSQIYQKRLKAEIIRIVREYPLDPPFPTSGRFPIMTYSPQNPDLRPVNKFKQMVFVPIIFAEKVMGIIHVANRENAPSGGRELNIASQFVGIFITSIKNAIIHRRTEKLAYTDPLTGLYNHRYFQETLKKEFVRASRYGKPLSLMMMDIDFFKKFNDTYGHLIGDQVLIHVGKIFENSVRDKIDTVARYGGEEFAVLLPETDLKGARHFADRLRQSVDASSLKTDKKDLHVTLSIGVACTLNSAFQKTSDLIAAADSALYKAKEGGRNQVKIFE